MLQLFHYPHTAAFAPHMLLQELGLAHELVSVDIRAGAQRDETYKRLNPNARVPTLVDGDTVVFEAAAICLHLLERHGSPDLIPQAGTVERGQFLSWLFWLTNTLQPAFAASYDFRRADAPEELMTAMRPFAFARLGHQLALLEDHLATKGPWLLGERFSALDLYLHMLLVWSLSRTPPARATEYPHLRAHLERVLERPAVRRAYEIEQRPLPALEPVPA